MGENTRAQLLEALEALYHHPTAEVRRSADHWLADWQRTQEAWSLADGVLHDGSSPMEAQYFCAQTLRTKVQRDFEELPAGAAESLRDSLVSLILRFSSGASPVRTQLCLALAAIPPHMPATSWGPGGLTHWLAERLTQGQSNKEGLRCLLEMLTVIPQEAGSYKDAIRPERRREYMLELRACAPSAMEMLSKCVPGAEADESLVQQVLEAFAAWLRLSGGEGMDGSQLVQHPLVVLSLQSLESTESFEAAADAVCELVWACVEPDIQPPKLIGGMVPLVQLLVSKVFALRPRFAAAAARARNESPPEGLEKWDCDDEDTAKGIARCFAEVGEAFIGDIVQASPEVGPLVEALLEVASYPDDTIAAISFNFWHCLAEALTVKRFSDADEAERERRRQVFVPAFERLVGHIRGRVRYPENPESMRREERQDFRRSRNAIADTLEDAALVVGGARIMELMVEPLQEMSGAISSGKGVFDWRTAESALYCLRAVHRSAPREANPVMMGLLSTLPQLPSLPGCTPQLLYTVALMVGAYAEWLSFALEGGLPLSVVQQLLTMLTGALQHSESASAGALAIRHICDACRVPLLECLPDLLRLHEAVVPTGVVASTDDVKFGVEDADVEQIVEGVTLVAAALPADRLAGGLESLMGPITKLLESCSSSIAPGASIRPLVPLVDRLTTVFRHFEPSEQSGSAAAPLVAEALGRCWPLIERLLEKAKGDQIAMEAICKAPRYALRTSGRAAASLLPTLLERLPQQFRATKQCTLLYVCSELVKTFGPEPAHSDAVGMLFQSLMQEVLPHLSGLAGFSADPDLADDAFLLAGRAVVYCPRYVFKDTAVLAALLDSAMHGLLVQQHEANSSVLAFFQKLLDPSNISNAVRAGVAETAANIEAVMTAPTAGGAPRGSEILRLMAAGAVGGLPRSRVRDVSDSILAVLTVAQNVGLQWLMESVNRVPEAVAMQQDKERFWKGVSQALSAGGSGAARYLEEAVSEFSDLCRRNDRAMQSTQQALLGSSQ